MGFSSGDVCRHCHIQYTDLQEHIHDYDGETRHQHWTEENYNKIIQQLPREDDDETEGSDIGELDEVQGADNAGDNGNTTAVRPNYGLRGECVFNQLLSFHCVTGLPPDSMHDLMEGVIPQAGFRRGVKNINYCHYE